MKHRTAVIGLGLFGREVAVGMSRLGHSVLAIDNEVAAVDAIAEDVDQALALDSTDEEALYEAQIDHVDMAVCAIGSQNVEASIMTTALLHQLGVPRIVSRASDDLHARILRQVGAHEVVNPEKEMGRRVAAQIAALGIREMLRLSGDVCMAEMPVPAGFVDRSLVDIGPGRAYSINVIGVQRGSSQILSTVIEPVADLQPAEEPAEDGNGGLLLPGPDFIFREGDVIMVVGRERDIERMAGAA